MIKVFLFLIFISSHLHCKIHQWEISPHIDKFKKHQKAKKLNSYLVNKEDITDGILVIKNKKIIFEAYSNGHHKDRPHHTWSISKSVLNALIGISVHEKKLTLKDSICEWGHKKHCKITVNDLLYWSSGLKWIEQYEDNPLNSDVLKMLYQKGHHDMAQYVLSRPLEDGPSQFYRYSSGDSILLMSLLKKAYDKEYKDLPWKKLFNKLGMTSSTWETDGQGLYVGSSYLYTTPRSLAKLGLLYYQNGQWDKKQLLPKWWVKYSTTYSESFLKKRKKWSKEAIPGAHWWHNKPIDELKIRSPLKGVPSDAYWAQGHWGQFLVIIPSEKLIIVRMGNSRKDPFPIEKFLQQVIELAKVIK